MFLSTKLVTLISVAMILALRKTGSLAVRTVPPTSVTLPACASWILLRYGSSQEVIPLKSSARTRLISVDA